MITKVRVGLFHTAKISHPVGSESFDRELREHEARADKRALWFGFVFLTGVLLLNLFAG